VSKWNSTVVALRDYSLKELQLQTRVSFATDDLLSDIVNSALKEGRQFEAFQTRNVVAALASSVLVPSFLLPTLPLPDFAKNVIGLLSIFSPFLVLGIGFLKPEAVVGGDPTNERDIEMLTDRIRYTVQASISTTNTLCCDLVHILSLFIISMKNNISLVLRTATFSM
jgi:hypothetical protein